MSCYKNGGCGVYEMYSCSECPASKPEYLDKNKSEAIATTPEYFARELDDESNVQKAINFLEKIGIQAKTENGDYRSTYDVLEDIGKIMYCESMLTEEQLDKLVDATNFSQYVNAAINYNGRLPTDEEYEKLREEYDNLKV